MAGIQDFIDLATKQLGIDKGAATSATGGLAALLRKAAGSADFAKLAKHVPGLERLGADGGGAGGATGGGSGAGGMLAGLAQKASGMLGGAEGASAGAVAAVANAGVPAEKASGFLALFVNFVKTKVPPDVLTSVLGKIPGLGALVGA